MHAKKVVLHIESSSGYGRALIKGIANYSCQFGPWEFLRLPPHYFRDLTKHKTMIERIKKWQPDGVIVREPREDDVILNLGIPTIVTPSPINSTKFPSVVTDDFGGGKMAAEYFLGLGYRNLAFCGYKDIVWSQHRCKGFIDRLQNESVQISIFEPHQKRMSQKDEAREITNWLHSLPSPVGLFACNDDRGEEIVEICKLEEIRVPEQIAVLGMDNDEITCSLCVPQMSSIMMDTGNTGFEAARLLDELMSGKARMNSQILLDKALSIIPRQSTDTLPIENPDVAEAVWFIRQNIRNKINASDVTKHVCISRNNLYIKFQQSMGKSIYEFIQDEKIKHISKLLLQTDMTVCQIALLFGEADDKNISRIFRKATSMTPHKFRISITPDHTK